MTRRARLSFCCATAAFVIACGCFAAPATAQFTTVSLSGDQAPGAAAGISFYQLDDAQINANGKVLFRAQLQGDSVNGNNDLGYYTDARGPVAAVAREGDVVPGQEAGTIFEPGSFFGANSITLNAAGDVAFFARFSGPAITDSDSDHAIVYYDGALDVVLREGPASVRIGPFRTVGGLHAFNANGLIVAGGTFVNTDDDFRNDGALVTLARDGSTDTLARQNSTTPGVFVGGTGLLDRFQGSTSVAGLTDAGNAVFTAVLNSAPITPGVLYRDTGTGLEVVARRGTTISGNEGSSISGVGNPVINASGQVAFVEGSFGNGLEAIYSDAGGSLGTVVREGDAVPGGGPGETFGGFGALGLDLNDAGELVFEAFANGSNNQGIYTTAGGALRGVVREGEQAHGAADGVMFSSFERPVINSSGQIVVQARLRGDPVSIGNDLGLYAASPSGRLVEIVREGNLFDIDDDPLVEDFRQVSSFDLLVGDDLNSAGRPQVLNDAGQLVFSATFSGGGSGVFVADLASLFLVPGDANGDERVDLLDFDVLAQNFGAPGNGGGVPNGPAEGDFNGDGVVDLLDFDILAQNFGASSPGVVPEPASVALLGLAGPMLFRGRGRGRGRRRRG